MERSRSATARPMKSAAPHNQLTTLVVRYLDMVLTRREKLILLEQRQTILHMQIVILRLSCMHLEIALEVCVEGIWVVHFVGVAFLVVEREVWRWGGDVD